MIKSHKTLSSEKAFESKYMTILKDRFESSNGEQGEYYYITNFNCVNVVGLDEDNNFILVKEYKYPIKQIAINCIGGKIDDGETPEQSAKREMMEEVGYEGFEIISFGKTAYASGRCDGWLHMFLIKDCKKINNPKHNEATEVTEEYKLDVKDGWKFIENNISPSGHTNLVLTRALLYLKIKP